MKTLGPKFSTQTEDSFHQYAKEVAKHQGIKRPETLKSKTRKKKNGKENKNQEIDISGTDFSKKA